MKKDDKIKVFAQVGFMKKPRWINAKFVERGDEKSVVEIYGVFHNIENHNIKKYDPLESQELVEEFANMNWDELKDVVIRAKDNFFPNIKLNFNEDEHTISYEDVELSPSYFERESIVGFKEIPCWSVGFWKSIPATRHEPEDVDFVSAGQSNNNYSAAKYFIDSIWRYQTEGFWENLFYDSLADETFSNQ